jgi:hypothetical protein
MNSTTVSTMKPQVSNHSPCIVSSRPIHRLHGKSTPSDVHSGMR